jgi:hypothetical protein
MRYSRAVLFLIVPLLVMLSGCSITINQPPNNGASTDPVTFNVTWNTSSMSSLHFMIDGIDQTSAFTINYGTQTATATINLAPTQHSLVVTGTAFFITSWNVSATSTFTIVIQ